MKLLKYTYILTVLLSPLTLVGLTSSVQATPGSASIVYNFAASEEIPTVENHEQLNCAVKDGQKLNENNCGIVKLILGLTNVMAAIAGLVIIGMIIWGGIQYSAAGADPSKVQQSKQKIINALLALLLLIFGYAILQWLIPGGILNGFR